MPPKTINILMLFNIFKLIREAPRIEFFKGVTTPGKTKCEGDKKDLSEMRSVSSKDSDQLYSEA